MKFFYQMDIVLLLFVSLLLKYCSVSALVTSDVY